MRKSKNNLTTLSLLMFVILIVSNLNSIFAQQDVWLQSFSAPNSGCGLTSSQPVNVSIYNNSGSPMVFNSITASYSIDGGAPVNQLIASTIAAFATINFTFSVNANLSTCGPHTLKTWVTRTADPNQLNDTLTWAVNNDCVIVPGIITPNPIVCAGLNAGALNLTGSSNGTILNWEMSNDGGTIWSNIVNNTSTFNYTNIPQTRQYRVFINGGSCPDAYSAIGTLTAIPQPIPGIIDGPDTLCITNAAGSIFITGTSNSVLQWESSLDNGFSWTNIANITYTNNFSSLIGTTLFRALIDGGICPSIYSDTAEIVIDLDAGPGVLFGVDSLCVTNGNGSITLSGSIGNTLYWQSSNDNGLTWDTISNTTNTLNFTGINLTSLYRAFTEGYYCPSVFSNTVEIYIEDTIVGGDIIGDGVFCQSGSGILNLVNSSGPILFWESSIDNGVIWTSIANTTTSQSHINTSIATLYRAFIEGLVCPGDYSGIGEILIDQPSISGSIIKDTTLCQGDDFTFLLSGFLGDSILWETSADGLTWNTSLTGNADSNAFVNVQQTEYLRAIVSNGVCAADTASSLFLVVYPAPVILLSADTSLFSGDSISLLGAGGVLGIWTPNQNINNETIPNPFVFPTETIYYVYTIIDLNGCINSDSILVTVNPALLIDIKNVITVNNDGFNDTWIIEGLEFFPNTSVRIFNTYGVEIYANPNYANDWDARYKGKKLPNGTYFYVVELSGIEKPFKGSLTLLGNE